MSTPNIPSLVGYRPEEAERIAQELGVTVRWLDAPPLRWAFPVVESRVGRQRWCADGALELLRVTTPAIVSPVRSPES